MAVYRIIPIENNRVVQYRRPLEVSSFFLGRRISAYIVIKTDDVGHRTVDLASANGDCGKIKDLLEQA